MVARLCGFGKTPGPLGCTKNHASVVAQWVYLGEGQARVPKKLIKRA